jgi:hypothetical protein
MSEQGWMNEIPSWQLSSLLWWLRLTAPVFVSHFLYHNITFQSLLNPKWSDFVICKQSSVVRMWYSTLPHSLASYLWRSRYWTIYRLGLFVDSTPSLAISKPNLFQLEAILQAKSISQFLPKEPFLATYWSLLATLIVIDPWRSRVGKQNSLKITI